MTLTKKQIIAVVLSLINVFLLFVWVKPIFAQTSTPTPTESTSSCAKKSLGDANCDGVINLADFSLWLQEFDTMVSATPPNQNANFACIEGNTQTYFVDLVDFEVWRRNTTSGLISSPSQPGGPTQTPGSSGTSCVNTSNCTTGLCCASSTHTCQPTNTAGITCLSGTSGTNISPTIAANQNQNNSNQAGGTNDKSLPGDNPGGNPNQAAADYNNAVLDKIHAGTATPQEIITYNDNIKNGKVTRNDGGTSNEPGDDSFVPNP